MDNGELVVISIAWNRGAKLAFTFTPPSKQTVESPFKSYCMDRIGPHSFEMLLLILTEMCQNVPARPSSVQAGSEVLAAQSDL
jgi:hypothetical protein